MTDLLAVLGLAAVSYLAILVWLYIRQRRLLFRAGARRPDLAALPAPAGFREIAIPSEDGLPLQAWYRAASDPNRTTILYLQGNAGDIGDRIPRILPYAEAGYGLLLAGYRGYGGNPGRPTEAGLYRDAEAHLAFLAGQGIPESDIVLFGESLGAAIAVEMAARGHGRALILEAPFCSVALSAWRLYPGFAWSWLVKDRFDSLAKIGRIRQPKLFLHGIDDRVTPAEFGRRLFAASAPPRIGFFIAGAGHGDLLEHGLAERVLDFLADLESRPQSRP